MFGATIDYYLLKPLTHMGNYKTEEELNRAARHSTFTPEDARAYLDKIQRRFGGLIPLDPALSYLDIGCGMGRLSFGLKLAGAEDVTGIDILARHIEEARTVALRFEPQQRPTFHTIDIHAWQNQRRYDVIFVIGAMEHIHSPDRFLKRLAELLSPGGRAFVSFEPFHSPIGDHMHGFFRVQIPWRGVLFSEKAILRLRTECSRPTDPVTRYQDVAGGLNLMRYTEYQQYVEAAGLRFAHNHYNPQLWFYRHLAPLRPLSTLLTKIPRVRDYFIVTDYAILEHQ